MEEGSEGVLEGGVHGGVQQVVPELLGPGRPVVLAVLWAGREEVV